MTWTIRIRGAGGLIRAEYLCPVHGRFESLVDRQADGDPPAEQPCPTCGAAAEFVISAPLGRVKAWEVVRGKSDPAPHPLALDTAPLADGMSSSEFRARRRDLWNAHDYAEWKANT